MGNEAVLGEWVSLSPCAHHTHVHVCGMCVCSPVLPPSGPRSECFGFSEESETLLQARVKARWQQKLPQARDTWQGPGSRCRAASNRRHVCPGSTLLFLATLSGPHSGPVFGLIFCIGTELCPSPGHADPKPCSELRERRSQCPVGACGVTRTHREGATQRERDPPSGAGSS